MSCGRYLGSSAAAWIVQYAAGSSAGAEGAAWNPHGAVITARSLGGAEGAEGAA